MVVAFGILVVCFEIQWYGSLMDPLYSDSGIQNPLAGNLVDSYPDSCYFDRAASVVVVVVVVVVVGCG